MDAGHLTLTFSETVRTNTLNVGAIRIQSTLDLANGVSHVLTTSSSSSVNGPIIVVQLSIADSNELKRILGLARSQASTFVSITNACIRDMGGLQVVAIGSSNALQIGTYIPDSTRPVLTEFDLDMDAETMTLVFDETVSAASLDVRKISLATASSTAAYTLLAGSTSSADGTRIVVNLAKNDVYAIKLLPSIATSVSNTVILAADSMILDMATTANGVASTLLGVTTLTADHTAPNLVSFDVNMDSGRITLHFDEPIHVSSFDVLSLTAQKSSNGADGNNVVLEGAADVGATDGLQVDVVLTTLTLDRIKFNSVMYVSTITSYLSVRSTFAVDMAGNSIAPILSTAALRASSYQVDVTSPTLVQYELNMNIGELTLTFSETISEVSFTVTEVQLQSASYVAAADIGSFAYTLTGGAVSFSALSTVVTVQLTLLDMNILKQREIGRSAVASWLVFTSSTVQDKSGDRVVALVNGQNAQMAAVYTPDTTRPVVNSLSLSMNTGVLTLSFSETVRVSTLQTAQLTLQSTATGGQSVTFTSSTVSTANNGPVVSVNIGAPDLNTVKQLRQLCRGASSSFLSFTAGMINDMLAMRSRLFL